MTTTTTNLDQPLNVDAIQGAFIGPAKQKLDSLIRLGNRINGFAIIREVEGSEPQRGFIDVNGLVGWWTPGLQALERAHVAMEALRVRCEQVEAAIEEAKAVERERDALRAQVQALSKDAARWRWLSDHMRVHWEEGRFTSLVRIVSEEWRSAINASVDRMMSGDWPDADQPRPTQKLTRPAVPEGCISVPVKLLRNAMDSEDINTMSDASNAIRAMLAAAPQPEAYAALTPEEVHDLTCMHSGAPWSDAHLAALSEVIAIYDQLRREGRRPVDPATQTTEVVQADPCPGCFRGGFCKKPTCGRLIAAQKGGA